ncbi:MAG: PAS domain-containing protein [Myxococcales bacterium]|nr:PAS domain-containing protein [Myxococcales bacterium]
MTDPPVVGIGASAGGLEALEAFFQHVPATTGLAFVVVQHLDPTQHDLLPELLQRATRLVVRQAVDGVRVEPGHVYVIAPDKELALSLGTLRLSVPTAPRGQRLLINAFFLTLAQELGERSVGVILSGMGSDGTLGLRAIRDAGGAAFVQAKTSAKFDGMPQSAIDAGLADVIAPVEELPARIEKFVRHGHHLPRPEPAPPGLAGAPLDAIVAILRASSGHDFSLYKPSTLYRRIERRMSLHQLATIEDYVRYLRETPREATLLFDELLIGVTSFFRDPGTWRSLAQALRERLSTCAADESLRAWVVACSSGEEAYTLAMIFDEARAEVAPDKNLTLKVFATDLDPAAIERARAGVYPSTIAADVSPERLARFFVQEDRGYRVGKSLRDQVVFATQDVLQDPPFTRIDLLTCRNLLIYLTPELQKKLIPLFHYSLVTGGLLLLGNAETIGGFSDLFTPSGDRLYLRRPLVAGVPPITPAAFLRVPVPPRGVPVTESTKSPPTPASPGLEAAEQVLLQRFVPAAIVTSREGEVLYVTGRTHRFLEVPAGKAPWNLYSLARGGLRHALEQAFQKALITATSVARSGVAVEPGASPIDFVVEPLTEPGALSDTVLVVFSEGPAPVASESSPVEDTALEAALLEAHTELRATREDMRVSQEALRSANEALQSTNEELQSTNEELTTSKEEMQSMNEELQTLNHELQSKVDELSRSSNDMKNLLDSTGIAILFLDDALNVRRFTPQAATLIKLIPRDVGRPLSDLSTNLEYPTLYDDARRVLRTLVVEERSIATHDGRQFQARIMPYRTADNRIDGLVLTFMTDRHGSQDA